MCPHCRAFITTDDKVCPYCDAQVGPRAVDMRSPVAVMGGLVPSGRFVTSLILLLNAGLYLTTVVYSSNSGNPSPIQGIDWRTLYVFGGKLREAIFGGDYWRLVTAGFLHGGILHFLMNTWAMFDLGATVEEYFGGARMVIIYFAGTVMGFAASTMWSPALSIGASAGLFGLIGAMIGYGSMHGSAFGGMVKAHYTRWAIYGLILGLIGNIDNAAHLGGLAGGFAVARIAGTPLLDAKREQIWHWLCYLCLALTAYSFAQMAATFARHSAPRQFL